MSIRSRIQNLIAAGNDVTGNDDTTLTDVVQSLIDGYGGESSTKYSITWDLVNVSSSTNRSRIIENSPLYATLTSVTGYTIDESTVEVIMGTQNITSSVYDNGVINIAAVTGDVSITAIASKDRIDLFNVTWANHAIACGQSTNNYNAWSPHNFQYDDVHNCFVFLQCHCDKHLNHTYTNWTLSVINPYDATEVENISLPERNGLGMLFIEHGVWNIVARGTKYFYSSSDRGVTWDTYEADANYNGWIFGIYKCGNSYFAGNDSNSGITYFRSEDLKHWQEISFDSSLGYSCLCETSFVEYDGYYWAFNRTNDSELGHPVILRSDDDGETWELFSDQMLHSWQSTVSCCVFNDYVMVADIDRPNGWIYYSKFDGETFETINSWKIPVGGDDFHNINIATNYEDTIVLEFMAPPIYQGIGSWSAADLVCDNVMLVGSTKALPTLDITYIDTTSDVLAYLNEHASSSVRGLYSNLTWTMPSGGTIRAYLGASVSEFVDEVELPLNFASLSERFNFTTKDGDHFVRPTNSPLLNLTGQRSNTNSYASPSVTAYITIKGIRYAVNNQRTTLAVLTNANNNFPLPNPDLSTAYITTSGFEWQRSLGLRRVTDIVRDAAGTNLINFGLGASKIPEGYHNFAEYDYTTVE